MLPTYWHASNVVSIKSAVKSVSHWRRTQKEFFECLKNLFEAEIIKTELQQGAVKSLNELHKKLKDIFLNLKT